MDKKVIKPYETNNEDPKCVKFIEVPGPSVKVNGQRVECQTEWRNPNRIDAAYRAGKAGVKMIFVYKDPERGERYGFYKEPEVEVDWESVDKKCDHKMYNYLNPMTHKTEVRCMWCDYEEEFRF